MFCSATFAQHLKNRSGNSFGKWFDDGETKIADGQKNFGMRTRLLDYLVDKSGSSCAAPQLEQCLLKLLFVGRFVVPANSLFSMKSTPLRFDEHVL